MAPLFTKFKPNWGNAIPNPSRFGRWAWVGRCGLKWIDFLGNGEKGLSEFWILLRLSPWGLGYLVEMILFTSSRLRPVHLVIFSRGMSIECIFLTI